MLYKVVDQILGRPLLPTAQAKLPAQARDAVAAGDETLECQLGLEPAHPELSRLRRGAARIATLSCSSCCA